jgi:hypothetical protein
LTRDEQRILHEGKQRRGAFTRKDFESGFIAGYNAVEHRGLVRLVRQLHDAAERAGIHTSDFYSPANFAVALFRKYGVRIVPCPSLVELAAYAAFFGGRIECAAYGTYLGPVWSYDIRRAYPYSMSLLPDLANGRWSHGRSYRPHAKWSLYHVRWAFPDGWRFYPFPWRDTNGAVYYPPRGSGWIWAPEIRRWWVESKAVTVTEAWHFTPAEHNVPPFGWQADVYRRSLEYELNDEKGPANALKLGQNSSYGKLAQQTSAPRKVGGEWVRARPTFHNPCYAGLTTSLVRSRMWDLMAEVNTPINNDLGVVADCTDAVYSTRPLYGWLGETSDLVSDDFGALKMERFDGVQSGQSGVYRTLREGGDPETADDWVTHGRGFANRNVPWDLINDGWRHGLPTVSYAVERFIGHRWARAQSKYAARSWSLVSKTIHLGAVGKRYVAPAPVYTDGDNPAERLYWTKPINDVEYYSESARNLPDFTRRQTWDATNEDVRDLGWEPTEELERYPTRRLVVPA